MGVFADNIPLPAAGRGGMHGRKLAGKRSSRNGVGGRTRGNRNFASGRHDRRNSTGCYRDGKKEIQKADTVTAKLKGDSKSLQTGDTSNLALWIALLFASGGAAIATTIVNRKKKYNK